MPQVDEPLTESELNCAARMRRLLDLFPPGSKAKIIREFGEQDGTLEISVKAKTDEALRRRMGTG